MLLTKKITIKPSPSTLKYYKELGYDIAYGDEFEVSIEHLTIGSHVNVEVLCDVCGSHMTKPYKTYNVENNKHGYDTCKKCSATKVKLTVKDKYGVDNVLQSDVVKRKIKQTCLDKYGVEYISQTDEHKIKTSNTWNKKTEEEIKEITDKSKQTMLNKYGGHYSGTDEYKKKAKKTNMVKYGCEFPNQAESQIQKIKDTCLKKYGFENVMHVEEIKNKLANTMNERYDGWYSKTEEFKNKTSETWINKTEEEISEIVKKRKETTTRRYGVSSVMKIDRYILNNIKKRAYVGGCKNFKNGAPSSSQQDKIYSCLNNTYDEVYMNYPAIRYSIDVVVILEHEVKIAIEYDSWHWHKDKLEHDEIKTKKLLDDGWYVLRIKSSHRVPRKNTIIEAIKHMTENDIRYNEIVMDGWINKEEVNFL